MALNPYIINLSFSSEIKEQLLLLYERINFFSDNALVPIPEEVESAIDFLTGVFNDSLEKNRVNPEREKASVQIFHINHPDYRIISLPWHLVYRENKLVYFCKSYSFAQGVPLKTVLSKKFKILFLVPSPVNTISDLEADKEYKYAYNAFLKEINTGKVQIDVLESGNLEAIGEKIENNQYEIIHLIGHSRVDGEAQFETENKATLGSEFVSYTYLKALLSRLEKKPLLFFLSSCDTASGDTENQVKSATHMILDSGVANVISYAFKVADEFAIRFASRFYSELAENPDIIFAFNEAIRTVSDPSDPVPSLNPQHYCAASDIFITNTLKESPDNAEDGAGFIGRKKELQKLTRLIIEGGIVNITGRSGLGKKTIVNEAIRKLLESGRKVRTITIPGLPGTLALTNLLMQLGELGRKHFLESETNTIGDVISKLKEKFFILVIYFPGNLFRLEEDPPETDLLDFAQFSRLPVVLISEEPYVGIKIKPELIELSKPDPVDFYRRCMQFDLFRTLHEKYIDIETTANTLRLDNNSFTGASVKGLIQMVHELLEGNYGLLEKFVERLEQKYSGRSITTIDIHQELYKSDFTREVIDDHIHSDLDLRKLLSLSPEEMTVLEILSRFDDAVTTFAFHFFMDGDIVPVLEKLGQKNLLETDSPARSGLSFYYIPWQYRKKLIHLIQENPGIGEAEFEEAYLKYYKHLLTVYPSYHVAGKIFDACLKKGDITGALNYGLPIIEDLKHQGRNSEALEIGLRLSEALGKDPDPGPGAQVNNLLGSLYNSLGDFQSSLKAYQQALILCRKTGDNLTRGIVLDNIAMLYRQFNDTEKAMKYSRESIAYFKETKNEKHLAICRMNLGCIYLEADDLANAKTEMEAAINFFEKTADSSSLASAYHNLANVHVMDGEFKEALALIEKSILLLINLGLHEKAAVTYVTIAGIFTKISQYDQSEICLSKALRLAEKINDPGILGKVYQEMGYLNILEHDYRKAFEELKKSYDLLERSKEPGQKYITLNYIGDIYKYTGRLDKAMEIFEQTVAVHENGNDTSILISSLNRLGLAYVDTKDYDRAVETLQKAYDLHLEKKIGGSYDTTLNNLGLALASRGNYDEASKLFDQLSRSKNAGDKRGLSKTFQNIGNIVFRQSGDHEKAIDFFNKSLELKRKLGDTKGIAISLESIGACYYKSQELALAKEFSLEALKTYKAIEDQEGIFTTQVTLSMCCLSMNGPEEALVYGEHALAIAQRLGSISAVANVLGHLSKAHHKLGNYKKALECQSEAFKMISIPADSVFCMTIGEDLRLLYDSFGMVKESKAISNYLTALKILTEQLGEVDK